MVFDFLRRVPEVVPEVKASATGRVVSWGSSGRVAWSPRDVVSLTRTGFMSLKVGPLTAVRWMILTRAAGATLSGTVNTAGLDA